MNVTFRETTSFDVEQLFYVRANTRQNPIPPEDLAEIGITVESTIQGLKSGEIKSWVCIENLKVVGFCSCGPESGEVYVLAVLPAYEGKGIGKRLLKCAVELLLALNKEKIWLAASPDPQIRAHGFYRAQGWEPSGIVDGIGDEIMIYKGKSMSV